MHACLWTSRNTKFVDFFPLKDKSAFGVSKCIRSFIHRWGKPGRILSDQGREFCASVNDELCKAYGIKRSVTSAYHPQTNGLAERTNRTLKTRLAKLCNTKISDWPDYLEEVAYSMRTQKQKSTGFTPYHLMFGRQHRPIDQDDMELEVEEEGLSPADESTDTSCSLEGLREEKVNAAQEKQTAGYNRRKKNGRKIYDLSVGMHVLQSNLRNESRKGGKMEPKWTGPYKILDIDCNQRVALETVKNGKKLNRRVFYNQLRPYLHSQLHDARSSEKIQEQLPTSNNRRGLRISPELQVLVTLRYVATGNYQLTLGDCTDMSQPSVSKIVKNVCIAIASLAREYIKFPNPASEGEIMQQFSDFAGMPGVIGWGAGCRDIPLQEGVLFY
ncbi:hypothetical protein Pcinc_013660 [Petrolisthes cinctipes]|uniref:Integrase catalytic domain-containing protein n=1 Tax=Petrolisthes cinctipes TaxID=88211 RepID=A0AAE1FY89_PETCI|nr:hypothetical protein Pcinc_013660 [Petrolisthes cinctipes]